MMKAPLRSDAITRPPSTTLPPSTSTPTPTRMTTMGGPDNRPNHESAHVTVSHSSHGIIATNGSHVTVIKVGSGAIVSILSLALYYYFAPSSSSSKSTTHTHNSIDTSGINPQEEVILKRTDALIGRDALLADMMTWIVDNRGKRMWLTIGSAGTGKSAISVGLSRQYRQPNADHSGYEPTALADKHDVRVLLNHICVVDEEKEAVQTFLSSLKYALENAEFTVNGHGHTSGDGDPFDNLYSLLKATTPPKKNKLIYVILIDGLDQSPSIASLLTHDTLAMLPSCIRLVCTSRLVPNLQRKSEHMKEIILDTLPSQATAVTAYIKERFPSVLISCGMENGDERKRLTSELVAKSGATFMYPYHVMKHFEHGDIIAPGSEATITIDDLPPSLSAYYMRNLKRLPPNIDYQAVRVVLEAAVNHKHAANFAAYTIDCDTTGITVPDLLRARDWTRQFMTCELETCGTRGCYSFDPSFVKFLLNDHTNRDHYYHHEYKIDPSQGIHRLAVFGALRSLPKAWLSSVTATPRFYEVMRSILRCKQPTMNISDMTPDALQFGRAICRLPEQYHLDTLTALEAERDQRFWNMHDIKSVMTYSLYVTWLAVMPERFMMHSPMMMAVVDATTGLTPLDGKADRITHINDSPVYEVTLSLDKQEHLITQLKLVAKSGCKVTVQRGNVSNSFLIPPFLGTHSH